MTKAKGLMSASTRQRMERTAAVLAAITAAGAAGIASAALDAVAGVTRDALLRHLGRLRREGKVTCVRAAWHSKYVLVEFADQVIAERNAKSRERWNDESRQRQVAQRRAVDAAAEARVLYVLQRVVDARTAPRARITGPTSVFLWGG